MISLTKIQNRLIALEVIFLLGVFLVSRRSTADLDDTLNFLGILCMTFNIATVAAPLAALHEVIKNRSTEYLPLPLCIANLLVTSEWLLYGILVDDFYIKFPNFVALIISVGQILPFFFYPRKRKTSFVVVEKL